MTIIFNDKIEQEPVAELIQKLDVANKEDGPHVLYLSSTGGSCSTASLLISYLNTKCSEWKLIGYEHLYSSAFDVFLDFKGVKEILLETSLVLHLASSPIETRETTKMSKNIQRTLKDIDYSNERLLKKLKRIGISNDMINSIKKGKDVWLYDKDIEKLKF